MIKKLKKNKFFLNICSTPWLFLYSSLDFGLFPNKFFLIPILGHSLIVFGGLSFQQMAQAEEVKSTMSSEADLEKRCVELLRQFKGFSPTDLLPSACKKVQKKDSCKSVHNEAIFHYDKLGESKNPRKILVFSLIHGDEQGAGSVGRLWMERLESIAPRNTWRVIPILNPDGLKAKTRTNANNIDLNRNFPTRDWTDLAQKYWKIQSGANPRRFPGDQAASEPEVKCALEHIEEFKPDFIISVHTPLNVLDFDGPRVVPPKYDYLPWKSLGHFPGSLGRYMWFERKTPVLTMELKPTLPEKGRPFDDLQDLVGTLVFSEMKTTKNE